MNGYCIADLDGSVMISGDVIWGDELMPAAENVRGETSSFINRQQKQLLQLLQNNGQGLTVVPNTARDLASFKRLKLRFTDHAILSMGAVILHPPLPGQDFGEPDKEWDAIIRQQSSESESELNYVLSIMREAKNLFREQVGNARIEEQGDLGMRLYASARESQPGALDFLQMTCCDLLPAGWWIHRNGHNLAFLPPYLSKERALTWFFAHLADSQRMLSGLVIGLGDSASDLPFMALCDYALVPTRSTIFSGVNSKNQTLIL